MSKREYIIVDALFDREEEENVDYESMGVRPPKKDKIQFDVLTRLIYTDKITAIGPSDLMGVTTIYVDGGLGFRVKGDTDYIMSLIYENYEPQGPTEDDFII